MEMLSTKVAYIFQTTYVERRQLHLDVITHLQNDKRGVVKLEEGQGRGSPEALEGQWRFSSEVE